MPLAEALVTVVILTIVLVIRRRLRGVQTVEPAVDKTDDQPKGQGPEQEFKSNLMAGAIATRFQIPGMGSQPTEAKPPEEATSQAAHVKTKLKLH